MAADSLDQFVDATFASALELDDAQRKRLRLALEFWLDAQLRRLALDAGVPEVRPEWEPGLRQRLGIFAMTVGFQITDGKVALDVPPASNSTWLLLRFGNTVLEGIPNAVEWVVAAAHGRA